jgi:hypothetical protein
MTVARLRLTPVGETMFLPRAPFLTAPSPAHRPESGL